MYSKTTKTVSKTEISDVKTFKSLENFQDFIKGHAFHTDNYLQLWESLGYSFNPSKKSTANKLYPTDREKKLSIYGNGFAYKNDAGNPIDFLTNYKNYSFDSAFEYIAKIYGIEYEIKPYNPQKAKKKANTTKTKENPLQNVKTDLEKETQTYFESRIYSELGLTKEVANNYFSPSFDNHFGIGIKYTNLEKEPIKYGTENKEFDRIRLTTPEGKKKYHSSVGSGYFPYITPLAYNQNLLKSEKVLYSIEGEFKAFFAVNTLKIACIGIGGIHLGTTIETKIDSKGYSYKDKHTAEFLPLTKEVIEKGNFQSYTLIFDSDTFQNEGKKDRALSFSSAIERQIIAADKAGIKNFTFTCINPNNVHGAKGLDDLTNHCEPSEIKEKLECNLYHNDLFWHFRIDISKPLKSAFNALKMAFLSSSIKKVENEKIELKGFINNQLLTDLNSNFVTSLLYNKYNFCHAPTGLGKSTFVEKHLVPFVNSVFGSVVLVVSPYNSTSVQQAQNNILFTSKTLKSENEKVNPIKRIKNKKDSLTHVFTNFDNILTAYEVLTNFYKKDVFVVIDEYDTLPFQTSFRAETIKKVFDVLELAQKTLFVSATNAKLPLLGTQKVFDVESLDKKPYNVPTLVFATKKQRLDCNLDSILKAIRNKKRVIVHYNSLDDCLALKKELESRKIITRICAADGKAEDNDNDFFETIKKAKDYLWNNEVEVILCTSVLERGINIITNKNVSCIYTNTNRYGFDIRAYMQFIARIRNYDCFDISNIIIDTNKRSYLPNESLKSEFDFSESLEIAKQDVIHHNEQLQNIVSKFSQSQKDRFINKVSQNVIYNTEKELFEVNYLAIMQDYSVFEYALGSPYFAAPTKVLFYQKELENESLKKSKEEIKAEKEAAEKAVFDLYINDFYTLLISVFSQTKDILLKSKCSLDCNPNESIQLSNFELTAAENLLKNHFIISKTVSKIDKNDLENAELKGVLVDKETKTIRKTTDLSKRMKAYIFYFLLTNSNSKDRVRETVQINELQRIISILESCKGKETSLYELLKSVNHNRKGKNLYTKKTLLELIEILFEYEPKRKEVNDKKITFYSFKKQKDFLLEMEKLRM